METLSEADYVGDIDPDWAWQHESNLAGKTLGEIEDIFRQLLKDRVEEFRSTVATVHETSAREDKSATREEVDKALATIAKKASAWHDDVRTAEHCIQLLDLSCEVYELTSKLDAWVATDSDGEQDASYRDRIYEAIERIPDLVDWDACENLKRLRSTCQSSSHTPEMALEPTMVAAGGEHHD